MSLDAGRGKGRAALETTCETLSKKFEEMLYQTNFLAFVGIVYGLLPLSIRSKSFEGGHRSYREVVLIRVIVDLDEWKGTGTPHLLGVNT